MFIMVVLMTFNGFIIWSYVHFRTATMGRLALGICAKAWSTRLTLSTRFIWFVHVCFVICIRFVYGRMFYEFYMNVHDVYVICNDSYMILLRYVCVVYPRHLPIFLPQPPLLEKSAHGARVGVGTFRNGRQDARATINNILLYDLYLLLHRHQI